MKVVAIFLLVLSVSGCSTLINGTDQVVTVDNYYNERKTIKVLTPQVDYQDTMPARVYVSGGIQTGEYLIQVEEECVTKQVIRIPKSLRFSYWLNVFNVVGFFVDYSTGAMWEYPEKFHVPVSYAQDCRNQTANSQ